MNMTAVLTNVVDLKKEPEALALDEKHPGLNDEHYVTRRDWFFNISRKARLDKSGMPHVEYTQDEHNIWRHVSEKLESAHEKHACEMYLTGKKLLHIQTQQIPEFSDLNDKLNQQHGIQLIPAEGLIDTRNFFAYLSNRKMPCTQFLRHHSNPEYTPEPDAVHDVIGHVPPLMDKQYVELIQLIGEGVKHASDLQLLAWERIYWFTVEFGLIEEQDEVKAFGAGLLSSFGELEYCFSSEVERKPFVLEEVINQDYDPTQMQKIIYVIPSIGFLYNEVQRLIDLQSKSV